MRFFACLVQRSMAALAAGLCAAASAAPPSYGITVLPTLEAQACAVRGLNDAAQVVGVCDEVGFVWSAQTGLTQISDPRYPHQTIYTVAINNAGVVLGSRRDRDDIPRPFIWDVANGFRYFGPKSKSWSVESINDANEVVGFEYPGFSEEQAFRWSSASGIAYLKPSDRTSRAMDINNAGQIVGIHSNPKTGRDQAVLMNENGTYTPILPAEAGFSYADTLNDLGEVAGHRQLPPGGASFKAFLWSRDTGVQRIDPRFGGGSSVPTAINDNRQVVGRWNGPDTSGRFFYWDAASGMLGLQTLLDPSDPLFGDVIALGGAFYDALCLNNRGQIAVTATMTGGVLRVLLLTPL